MSKIKVGVLGATGAVGQKFVKLLENHPWFEVTAVAASDRSAGKPYAEAVSWKQNTPIPAALKDKKVKACKPDLDCQIVFPVWIRRLLAKSKRILPRLAMRF